MGTQNRPFRALAASIASTNSTTAALVNLNYNNGTRTARIVNGSTTASVFVRVDAAATTTDAMQVLPRETEYLIVQQGATQLGVVADATDGISNITMGEGGV